VGGVLLLVLVGAFLTVGCGRKTGVSPRQVTVLVYIDQSQSIVGYQHGGLAGIHEDYRLVNQAFLMGILQRVDTAEIEVHAFARNDSILFGPLTVEKWEQVRGPLGEDIARPPYPESEQAKTLFSSLVENIGKACASRRSRDFYVLVLTDGHPDEPIAAIKAAALACRRPTNLKYLLIASVEPDMVHRWRESLQGALAPWGPGVAVVNHLDYQQAVDTALAVLEKDGDK